MLFAPLSPPEYAQLASLHAHRHPEKLLLTLPGERGEDEQVPVVVGLPSGACKMPAGQRSKPAWADFLAATFQAYTGSQTELVYRLAQDCVLWPSPAQWDEVVQRWPGAADIVWGAVRASSGLSMGGMSSPAREMAPPAVKAVLEQHPRAAWRRFKPGARVVDLVIDAPKAGAWQLFSDAFKADDADRWKLLCDMAEACVVGAFEDDQPQPFGAVVMPAMPGVAVAALATMSQLAGQAARVERDAW